MAKKLEEKAFLSVGLQAPDRDATRFLWLKDTSNTNLENNIQVYRFCRIPFGVISSPFLLSETIKYHLQQNTGPIAKLLQRDIYVDNVITSVNSLEEAKELYTEAKGLFNSASMNLREWASNSQLFMAFVPHQDRVGELKHQRVLGINWNAVTDEFSVSKSILQKLPSVQTKREVLQIIASIFDPLGYFTPSILEAKFFMRELWTDKCGWDTKLNDKQMTEWLQIGKNLETIPQHHVPRYIGINRRHGEPIEYTLICFCDTSAKAYSAAIYLRQSFSDACKTDLIFCKTRLAPQNTTIPRLELLGVLIGVRALKFVMNELHVQVAHTFVFTDSLCVLYWLSTKKPLSLFVTNRLKEITALEGIHFRHIPSEENPADLATRGKAPVELSSMWWKGPNWLSKCEQHWPTEKTPAMDNNCQQLFESE